MILPKSLILFQVLYCLVMEPYRCYYCNNGYENFEKAVLHGSQLHQHELLKVRSLELNLESGKFGYRTHNFNVKPSAVQELGQVIEIKNDEPGFLCVGLRNRPQEPLEIIKSPLSKKIRLESTDTPHPSCFAEEISDDESNENVDNDIEFLIKQTPIVVDKLRELGMIELWKTFYTMLSNGTFPVDNIAFLLFLDVVKWYGKSNTLAMRYDETVCKFWRVGYKLFHGKFLRFMSGPKNKGQLIFGQSKTE